MSAATNHVDPMLVMLDALEKINGDHSKYDDKTMSMFYLIATLIAKMEGYGGEVAGMANESSAFSEVQSAAQKVDRDIIRIQKWKADHKDVGPLDALKDPE